MASRWGNTCEDDDQQQARSSFCEVSATESNATLSAVFAKH